MAALLLLLSGSLTIGLSSEPGPGPDSERGRMQLWRVRGLAAHPRYGECWSRALEQMGTRCRDMTSESQSRIALHFTRCHLDSSGRDFPSCPEGSEVSRCTAGMDAVAFNTFTEFFTHAHSICHFLQSESWQSRAETAMFRLTETSAGVAEELQSTKQVTSELLEAQSSALQAQKEILSTGEELKITLRDSTQGLQSFFSDLHSVSREQQVALSEIFNRVSFLQSFLLMETHSFSSCCYNAAALCTCFLITSTPRSSRARLVLVSLVCLNFYLERKIYQAVMSSDHPEHLHLELVSVYVGVLRKILVCVGVLVLLLVCVRYRDPVQESLQVLQQLQEMEKSLQEVLQRAESLEQQRKKKWREDTEMKKKWREDTEMKKKWRDDTEMKKKWREDTEMKKKWREDTEMKKKWREDTEMKKKWREDTEMKKKWREDTEMMKTWREDTEMMKKKWREDTEMKKTWREDTEMKKKWREDTEMKKKWREDAEMKKTWREDTEMKKKWREDTEMKKKWREDTETQVQRNWEGGAEQRSSSHLSHLKCSESEQPPTDTPPTHNSSVQSPARRPPSPHVYSILVEDRQPRYSLRNRRLDPR